MNLTDDIWTQATLPISLGGIGITSAIELCTPAYLASIHSVSELIKNVLTDSSCSVLDHHVEAGMSIWQKKSTKEIPEELFRSTQIFWSYPIQCQKHENLMQSFTHPQDKARLLALTSKKSNFWLQALPCGSLGTLLDNDSLRISMALRLGAEVVKPHSCICGALVSSDSLHGLNCQKSGGRRS